MMNITPQQIAIAAGLYRMQDSAKRIMGDGYKSAIREYAGLIQKRAERDGIDTTKAMIEEMKCASAEFNQLAMACIGAAFIEMIEGFIAKGETQASSAATAPVNAAPLSPNDERPRPSGWTIFTQTPKATNGSG